MVAFDEYGESISPLPVRRINRHYPQYGRHAAREAPQRPRTLYRFDEYGEFGEDQAVRIPDHPFAERPPRREGERVLRQRPGHQGNRHDILRILLVLCAIVFAFICAFTLASAVQGGRTALNPHRSPSSSYSIQGKKSERLSAPVQGTMPHRGKAVCIGTNVNIRETPSLSANPIGTANRGDLFIVDGILANGWIKVIYHGTPAYIFGAFLNVQGEKSYKRGICMIHEGSLNMRNVPSPSSDILAQLDPGARVLITGEREGYFEVQLPGGAKGWCAKAYVRIDE